MVEPTSVTFQGVRKGRSIIYHYYVCTYPRGRCPRYPIDWTHDFITTILGGIKLSVDNINKHRKVFESIIKNESQLRTNSITHTVEGL